MRPKSTRNHPQRTLPSFRLVGPQAAPSQLPVSLPARALPVHNDLAGMLVGAQDASLVDASFDYGRVLTRQGGILITYKDLDVRLRHILGRVLVWTAFTGLEAWLLFGRARLESPWIGAACLFIVAVINFLIVWKLPEVYRTIEIRPDCLILEGSEVFWLEKMQGGWPTFEPDDKGNQILCGIYGTRLVEYLTARRFDDYDRAPEVLAAHIQEAMEQLWGSAVAFGKAQPGSPRPHRR
jgi:hypothetical protein